MSKEAYDIVIVGAGIVGAACADAFAERGLRVCVVDRDVVGGGATAAGMGHIVVMDDSDAQFALTYYSSDCGSNCGRNCQRTWNMCSRARYGSRRMKRKWLRCCANESITRNEEYRWKCWMRDNSEKRSRTSASGLAGGLLVLWRCGSVSAMCCTVSDKSCPATWSKVETGRGCDRRYLEKGFDQ